jgi:hypothetical protein
LLSDACGAARIDWRIVDFGCEAFEHERGERLGFGVLVGGRGWRAEPAEAVSDV